MTNQTKRLKPLIALAATVLTLSACGPSTDEARSTVDRADASIEPAASSEPTANREEVSPADQVAHNADSQDEQADGDEPPAIEQTLPLFGDLADDVAVLGVGTYKGVRPSELNLDNTSHGTTVAEVYLNMPDRPVLLVLSAYEPVLWQVDHSQDTNIIGVLVSGYHGQAVTGLHSQTPTFISSYEAPGDFRPTFVAHGTSPDLLEANEIIEQLTGKKMESFTDDAIDGVFFVGESGPEVENSEGSQIEVDGDPYDPSTADPAIASLVAEGKLRPATIEDAQAWLDKHNERYAALGTEVEVLYLSLGRTFVVTAEVRLPDGLFGAHSVAFIVPEDVPQPAEPEGHNDFYWMADGSTNRPLE